MADVSVRPARPEDAVELGRIHVETWRWGYRDLLPADVLTGLSVGDAIAAWSAAITAPPTPRHHVLVALEGATTVGFTAGGPADELPDDDPAATDPATTAEVAALLVEPRWQRRGHGSRLMAALTDVVADDGMTRLQQWIPERDTASREFLIGAGFAPDGLARVLDTGMGELREIRLHALLAAH